MRKCLILLFAFTATSVSGAPAWTWVDANGQVHYSDTPVPGAKRIELSSAQSFGSTPQRQQTTESRAAAGEKPAATSQRYRTLNIVSPKQQETLWNVGGTVIISLEMDPALRPGDRIDLYVDGAARNLNTTSTDVGLDDMGRGVHTVQAVIFDASGGEVQRSPTTTFMIQQTSIQNPQRPRPTPHN